MIDAFGIKILREEARGKLTIVDAGCGNGVKPLYLARRNPSSRIYGYDICAQEIEKANESKLRHGIKNVNFSVNSHEDFPLPDSIDLIYTSGSLVGQSEWERRVHYLAEELVIPRLEKFTRSLSPAGKYILYSGFSIEDNNVFIELAENIGLKHEGMKINMDNPLGVSQRGETSYPSILIFNKNGKK